MKFFLPSTAIVLVLALCAQSAPGEQGGCGKEYACLSYQTCSSSQPKTCVDPWTPVGCYEQTDTTPPTGLTLVTPTDPATNPGVIASGQNGFDPLQCWTYCKNAASTATSFGLKLQADPTVSNAGETFCYCYINSITSGTATAPACDYTFGLGTATTGAVLVYKF
jgi:hypothetical protein